MFKLGYYHGYNGFLVSDFHCKFQEYMDGYLAGMNKQDADIDREYHCHCC